MAERKSCKKGTRQSAKSTTGNASKSRLRAAGKADGESDVLAKMPEPDGVMAERLHAIIKASAPAFRREAGTRCPRMPRTGKVVCFFQSAQKVKTRYATFGFSDKANLDDGAMSPRSFALKLRG
jgi:hypothetical protein